MDLLESWESFAARNDFERAKKVMSATEERSTASLIGRVAATFNAIRLAERGMALIHQADLLDELEHAVLALWDACEDMEEHGLIRHPVMHALAPLVGRLQHEAKQRESESNANDTLRGGGS